VESVATSIDAMFAALSPEKQKEAMEAAKLFKAMSVDQKDYLLVLERGRMVQSLPVSVEGFSHFYWCNERKPLPPMARDVWIPELIKAWENRTGVLIESARGMTKSTILFWWVGYIQGKNPVGNSVLVRINDGKAAEVGKAFAEL
jgi:hypothetical protein